MQGHPKKGLKKFFALRAKYPYMASAFHAIPTGCAVFFRARQRGAAQQLHGVLPGVRGQSPWPLEIFWNLGHFPQRKTSSAGIAPPVPGTAPPRLALTWATPDVGDGERTLRRHQRLMRSQSRCSRPRVLATEGFPDPCSPRANPLARHHHGHRPHLRQVRRHGEPSEEPGTRAAGSRQPEWHEAGGRGQGAGSRGWGAEETWNRRRHR